jgi:hypothetical protein
LTKALPIQQNGDVLFDPGRDAGSVFRLENFFERKEAG